MTAVKVRGRMKAHASIGNVEWATKVLLRVGTKPGARYVQSRKMDRSDRGGNSLDEPRHGVDYEPALRVIGRHLDAEPAYHISLLETVDGFTVRSHPSGHRPDGTSNLYSWDRLNDLVIYQTAGRGVRRRRSRHSGMWANFPNGHEDFFRALGHELDEQQASSLAVDEVPEGVAVSYLRPRAAETLLFEKVHRVMRREDIEEALRAARARRGRSTTPTTNSA